MRNNGCAIPTDASAQLAAFLRQREIRYLRERLAGLFGCDPEEMAITRNTSERIK